MDISNVFTDKRSINMKKVNRYTRAGGDGKIIQCPHCQYHSVVYLFSWCAIVCQGCKAMVDKKDFFIPELSKEKDSEIIIEHLGEL